jgi:sugar phosphate isomerase/epimerase
MGKLLAAGVAGLLMPGIGRSRERIGSVIRGVQVGAQSYSFRMLSFDACVQAFRTVGLGECELSESTLGRPQDSFEEHLAWLQSQPLSEFESVRKRFDDAGVLLYAWSCSLRKGMTDQQIERGFQIANALGVHYITSSANLSIVPRVDAFAQKYRITVGFHGHDKTDDPDEFSTAETFARAMNGASRYIGVNLDIGHFTAAGGDAVAYLRAHHDRIVTLHIKDRKKNHGPNMPFGEGDTPIVAILRLLRDNQWTIPANIEYEYGTPKMNAVAEVKKCFEYCRTALEN